MNFDVFGPEPISRPGKKQTINRDSCVDLALRLEEIEQGLSEAVGCYVFAKRAGKGIVPWYVGQACRTSIARESLNPSNREKYNNVEGIGTPVLFLIPLRTPGGKFRKPSKGEQKLPELNFLERWLIATSLDRNPDLVNSKETRFLRNIHVKGIMNARHGESTKSSQLLSRTLGW